MVQKDTNKSKGKSGSKLRKIVIAKGSNTSETSYLREGKSISKK